MKVKRWTAKQRMILVLGFLALAVGGDRMLALGLDQVVLQSGLRYSRLYRGGLDKSILVLGNSRAVNTFYAPDIEKQLGVGCINLSHNAMSTEVMEALLLDYLEVNEKPDLVVLEVTSLSQDSKDPIEGLLMYTRYSKRLDSLCNNHDATSHYAVRVVNLFAYNSEMFLRALYYTGKSDQSWANRYTILPSLVAAVRAAPAIKLPQPRPENLAALKRILSLAQDRGIRVELVVAPYLPEYRDKLENFSSWVDQIARAVGPHVAIRDYSRAVEPMNLFADRVHLNLDGARYLLELLITDGLFETPPQNPPDVSSIDTLRPGC
jgi:hypothetical protein